MHDNNTFLYQGSQNSTLTVTSTTKFAIDASTATLSKTQSYSFAIGQAGTVSGLGTAITDPTLFTVSGFSASDYNLSVTTANNVVYLNLAAVPEPTTVGLLAAAGLGTAGWVRRRRAGGV